MPNWCGNYTEIEGPVDVVQELFVAGKEERFLEHMAPLGEWDYNDALSSWGTKWEIDIGRISFKKLDNDRAILQGYFESAWSPPEQAFLTFLYNNKDVNVKLLYHEPSMDFAGSLEHGTHTISKQGLDFYNDNPIGQELDEAFAIVDDLEQYIEEEMEEAIHTDPSILINPENDDSKAEETT
tara:strand:+ start:177 stop:722 length:546 start_codon:yes stop_codon:yes gene_type:complete